MLDKHFLTPQPHLEERHYYIDFLPKSHSEIAEISQLSVIYIQVVPLVYLYLYH